MKQESSKKTERSPFATTGAEKHANLSKLAKDLGIEHNLTASLTNKLGKIIVDSLRTDYERINSNYNVLEKKYGQKPIGSAEKWLIENQSLILESAQTVKETLSSHLVSRLPTLKSTPTEIRIFVALTELVSASDFRVNYNRIRNFIEDYQSETRLTIAELWAIPLILKALLINGLAASLGGEKTIKDIVLGLRNLQKIDWGAFVEDTSWVEKILRHDPTNEYQLMDFRTRDSYRHVIEEIHFQTKHNQTEIAEWVIEQSKKLNCHVGYFLLGIGRDKIDEVFTPKRELSENFSLILHKRPTKIYLGITWGILLVTLIIVQSVIGLPIWCFWLLVFPSFGFASLVTHLVIVRLYPPSFLPKMDSTLALTDKVRTIVLTPTLLTTEAVETERMLSNLEENYLANKDSNIFFGVALSWPETSKDKGKPTPGELAALEFAKKSVSELNSRYPSGEKRFHMFFRERKWSVDEQSWVEWERKRGKVIDFVHLLRNTTNTSFSYNTSDFAFLSSIKYVIIVDDDVLLPRDTAKKLIGTISHPLNVPQVDQKTKIVTKGYGIIQPRISSQMYETKRSLANYIFEGETGWDSYSNVISSAYQDIFKESFFLGKGIFDVDTFDKVLTGRFPENTLLSHDHIEGFYCRTGFASDITVFETSPSTYLSFYRRLHRWVRGDWQRIFWILPWVGNEKGKAEKNPLSVYHKWKLAEDLFKNLNYPATIVLAGLLFIIFPQKQIYGLLLFLAVVWANPIFSFLESLIWPKDFRRAWRHYLLILKEDTTSFFSKCLFNLVFSLHQALIISHAIVTALVRTFFTKRKRLEWATFSQGNQRVGNYSLVNGLSESVPTIMVVLILSAIVILFLPPAQKLIPMLLFSAWLIMPVVIVLINQIPVITSPFSKKEEQDLRIIARKTWRYFDDLVNKKTNFLPPDHFQQTTISPISTRTSATDIGMYMTSVVAAFDLGFLSGQDLLDRLGKTMGTLSKLEQLHGHFFNWYDITTLKSLHPYYISTVDSGNLASALLIVYKALSDLEKAPDVYYSKINRTANDLLDIAKLEAEPVLAGQLSRVQKRKAPNLLMGLDDWRRHLESIHNEVSGIEVDRNSDLGYWIEKLKELLEKTSQEVQFFERKENKEKFARQCRKLSGQAEAFAMKMDFSFLYDPKTNLFRIGYNLFNKTFDRGFYDLFASEARMTSLFAIAKYDAPLKHWTTLSKPMTVYNNQTALLSWGGSVFEYLFPNLFLPNYPNSLLWETYRTIVAGHIEYGQKNHIPWGISESSYGLMNKDGHYRYKLHGVPDFGLKNFSYKDLVVSPYSVFLSMEIFPGQAYQNIRWMEREGVTGIYGLYESIDYTSYESGPISDRVIKAFLCHHQGIVLTSITNILNDYSIRNRFSNVKIIKAHRSLLQEAIPRDTSYSVTHIAPETDVSNELSQIPEPVVKEPGVIKLRHTPQFNLLSNGRYHVYLDDRGGGYSQYQNFRLTNWVKDPTFDYWGNFLYLKDLENQNVWSATIAPTASLPEKYEVFFSQNYSNVVRSNWGIETELEIAVPFDTDTEIRCLTIRNTSSQKRLLELTNYAEIVLDDPLSNQMHPVFSKMRVESRYTQDSKTLSFHRLVRPSQNVPIFASRVVMQGGNRLKFTTDRLEVLGRGGSVILPKAVSSSKVLTGSTGFTLDPVACWSMPVTLNPRSTETFCFLYTSAYGQDAVFENLNKFSNIDQIKMAIEFTKKTEVKTSFEEVNQRTIQQTLTCLMYGRELSKEKYSYNVVCKMTRPKISLDWSLPTIVILAKVNTGVNFLRQGINMSYVISNFGVKFNVVIIVRDSDNYYQTTYNTVLEVANSFENIAVGNNLASPLVTIVRAENLKPGEVKFLVATSSLVLDSDKGNVGAQVNVEFNKI